MAGVTAITDAKGRRIDYARISVTDRCNYRCVYCMPEDGVAPLRHEEILRYEDILWLGGVLSELGVRKVRFTGGEPLVRKGMVDFLKEFRHAYPAMALSLTTNAALLDRSAEALGEVALSGLNISLDTVNPEKFHEITRIGDLDDVRRGIVAAKRAGILNLKTNTVLIRGFNDDELPDILDFSWGYGIVPRLIEFMPLGDDVWSRDRYIDAREILERLERIGRWLPMDDGSLWDEGVPRGPAKYYRSAADGRVVGVISAVSAHFCASCNRLRITAAGGMLPCLFATGEIPLMGWIRDRDAETVKRIILEGIETKPDCWERTRDGKRRMSCIGG
jgi:molybdenum cofactor biosynthesis protein A, bacterial